MTTILGNISIPAETKYVEKISDVVTTFSLAENRRNRKGDETTVYHRISIFGKRGKNLAPYLTKGKCLLVTGLETAGAYVNAEGQPVAYLQMNNPRIQFASGPKASDPTEDIPEEVADAADTEEAVGEEAGPF